MALSKKIRFEVFKRDSFTCQYCGSTPPEVILECDHINPKSKGGSDIIDNLITSCFDCNRGKSDNLLNDIPKSISSKIDVLKEKESQLSEYNSLIEKKRKRLDEEIWLVINVLEPDAYEFNRNQFKSIGNFINKLGLNEVLEAADISVEKDIRYEKYRFKYFCGVCWGKIREK